eukprot:6477668-Pyramimonas_sp.AAC.1
MHRIADASPMRFDAEPHLFRVDVADASPTSTRYPLCIVGASPMHRRCGATLRPHLLRPRVGGLNKRKLKHCALQKL